MSAIIARENIESSLWAATCREATPDAAKARGALHSDIAVVGAGYTGLSAALHLAEEGATVSVIEAGTVGAGASGINGGQVIPGLKRDPDDLERLFQTRAPAIVDVFASGPDLVFSLIDHHTMDCSPVRKGWILAAHAQRAMPQITMRWRQWRARGGDVDLLSGSQISELTGSSVYAGGLIDRRAGTVQPLAYARGLARAAQTQGVMLYEDSPVETLARSGAGWRLRGRDFDLSADRVVIATDAYSGKLLPSLERSMLTVSSLQIATEPLSERLLAEILPSGQCLSETRKVAVYLRRDPEGRLLIGGRGPIGNGGSAALYESLYDRLVEIFPKARGLGVQHRWRGRVGLTLDELPHLHEPEPGLHIGLGYNGRGVAAATMMGKIIASRITGGPLHDVLPVTKLSAVPWRIIRQPLLTAAVSYYRLRDRLGFGA